MTQATSLSPTPETISLEGSWKLQRVEQTLASSGEVIFCESDRNGFIHYMADGRVAVLIASSALKPVAHDRFSMTEQEQATCYNALTAYGGTWQRQGTRVIHSLDFNSYPNDIGTDYIREIEVDGQDLVLNAPAVRAGEAINVKLVWRRLSSMPAENTR